MLVRTWNLFHGNADPPRRRGYLRAMVELVSADHPDVVCLQEVPVWALPRLDNWAGMRRFEVITRPPFWLQPLGAWLTRRHQGFFRSGLAGQANAILVAPGLDAEELGHERISEGGRERRLVHAVRVAGTVVANLHASNEFRIADVTLAEIELARSFVERLASPGDVVVLAGDFNATPPSWEGWSAPGPGIDHVLVRGGTVLSLGAWPRGRRVHNGVVLSDHAPVDLVFE